MVLLFIQTDISPYFSLAQWSSVILIQSRFDPSCFDPSLKIDSIHIESRFDSISNTETQNPESGNGITETETEKEYGVKYH